MDPAAATTGDSLPAGAISRAREIQEQIIRLIGNRRVQQPFGFRDYPLERAVLGQSFPEVAIADGRAKACRPLAKLGRDLLDTLLVKLPDRR